MLLDIHSLSCTIGEKSIFTPLSFQVDHGELVCIEGGSGRGKSSLLFGIRGISHEEKKYTGKIFYNNAPVDTAARQGMGLILQNPHSQMVSTLVREELMFGMENGAPMDIRERFQKEVEILGLDSLLDQSIRTLSSGQKHLVAIAAAGIRHPELLLMDEPFLYLDPANIRKILDYISYLRKKGVGVLLTSHPGIIPSREAEQVVLLAPPPKRVLSFPEISLADPAGEHGGKKLILDRVGYGYDGKSLLAANICLEFSRGKEFWIEGNNGSGKTTLLNILSGGREPEWGEVIERGGKNPFRVITLTQNPDRHFFEPTVKKEMAAALMGKQRDLEKLKAATHEINILLDCVGLAGKAQVSPFKLSFGEKVHLAAAQAVLLRPDFIFVDDILGFLDGAEREHLLFFLRTAMARTGCGLVFTSSRGRYANTPEAMVICLGDYLPKAKEKISHPTCYSGIPGKNGKQKKRTGGVFKQMLKAFKAPAYDYVPGTSPLHNAPPWIKMTINMAIWFLIYTLGPRGYLPLALLLFFYYLLSGMGVGRFLADSRFFVIQSFVFAVFMPIFRWDISAVREGVLAGVRVWLFFIPVMVMMRTTTVGEWMSLFSRFLSRNKKLAMGIAFGLLPCITADAREIIHIQSQKGLMPDKKDLLHPKQLFVGLKALFIPLLILMEDICTLAGLSLKLKGMEE
ncbi:ABC-type glutathione transport system ATPase component, contains duplicated ATPase domain [Desulfocicer vacuolatum DSM 3385]|uniref:ABC-type glutathione transport system ATPase component, contains duplicated ATPase domain n=1 Tax=Desulfocicer vacuolatum DSM 3385 TaxID=1121400 RepID=A0A1W2AD81_9BACT|nr:ATP-binding cassette domain-containing protein [Desulfocicer vacuolatum]SMC58679.1 ABC-type glutathione transport system ATPase component, contains duplicated ATPase domain [Desulfocicer vacuolatum DSM 3385]